MRFASLGSGSRGNASLIEVGNTCILVDCGFSLKQINLRLERLNKTLEDIDAIFLSHEHQDHIQGANSLIQQTQIPLWASSGTANYLTKPDNLFLFGSRQKCKIKDIEVTPIIVPHDAAEPYQFILNSDNHQLGILTDTGHITSHILDEYSGCTALMLEANYDNEMLQSGTYPKSLKLRISGNFGHLSNQQSVDFLNKLDTSRLQHLALMHISEKNNTIELAKNAVKTSVEIKCSLQTACQENGFDWIELV